MDQQWINDIDEKFQRAIIKKHHGSIKYINKPRYWMVKIVIDNDVDCINGIELCERSQIYLLNKYPDMFYLIEDPTQEVIEMALDLRPANIQYVKRPTDEQMIKVLSINPKLIELFSGERYDAISDYVKSYSKLII